MSALPVLRVEDRGWVSGSALAAAVHCAASAVLVRVLGTAVSATRIGSAMHEHVRQRNLYGVSEAIRMLPELAVRFELDEDETSIFIARSRAFEWSPPEGAIAELALCLFEDGSVRVVEGGKGEYDLPPDALIPAQIDLFWAEPTPLYRDGDRIVCPPESTLWAVDFKSGKEDYVAPAERNAQALVGLLLAAKFTGAKRGIPGIVFLRKGEGLWDVPDASLDEHGIARVEAMLRAAVLEVRRQRTLHAAGLPLSYREGMHCNMCRARHGCPAHLATLKTWLSDPAPLEPGILNDAQAKRLAELAPAFRRFAASVDAALRAHVEDSGRPLVLSDGRVYGPHAKTTHTYDTDKAIAILTDEVGALAVTALSRKVTKSGIERVIRADHEAKGVEKKRAEVMRRFYARLASAEGIVTGTKVQWGVHKPKPEALANPERLAQIASLHGLPIDGDEEDDDDD